MRVVIERVEERPSEYLVEIDFDPDWTSRHRIVLEKGRWIPSPEVEFVPARKDVRGQPTARRKRAGRRILESHLPRIERLLTEALDHDDDFRSLGRWRTVVSDRFGITAPRSRRGRRPKVDPDEVRRLQDGGLSNREIGEQLGIHEKTVANVVHKRRKRTL